MIQISNLPFLAITAFKEAELIREGLTIPFLVGIYQQLREKQGQSFVIDSPECIKDIINDILVHDKF